MTQPFVIADGIGVDSTAMLLGLHARGRRPDLIMFADTGGEKDWTTQYIQVRREWLAKVGWPDLTIVRNVPQDFKHWPPYYTLEENCLTNGTLPSLAFGFKSCSLKWKVAPQNAFCKLWEPARRVWAANGRVLKAIGYDASGKDRKRYATAIGVEDPDYEYIYPLIEWGWDREMCKEVIRKAGLPLPSKSACHFCPATQPEELHELKKKYLRRIVVMEARAAPRLEGHIPQAELDRVYHTSTLPAWEAKCQAARAAGKPEPKQPRRPKNATGVLGLWRRGRKGTRGGKKMPGMMTDFIVEHGLLPAEEVRDLQTRAPKEILDNQKAFANGVEIPAWHDFLELFTEEDGCGGCEGETLQQLGAPKIAPNAWCRVRRLDGVETIAQALTDRGDRFRAISGEELPATLIELWAFQ